MNNHTASLEITVNVLESVLSRKLLFWTSNWKHVIKYDLYVKFPRSFAHNIQTCAKFVVKISMMFAKYFEYYTIILRGGGRFLWTRCTYTVLWCSLIIMTILCFLGQNLPVIVQSCIFNQPLKCRSRLRSKCMPDRRVDSDGKARWRWRHASQRRGRPRWPRQTAERDNLCQNRLFVNVKLR